VRRRVRLSTLEKSTKLAVSGLLFGTQKVSFGVDQIVRKVSRWYESRHARVSVRKMGTFHEAYRHVRWDVAELAIFGQLSWRAVENTGKKQPLRFSSARKVRHVYVAMELDLKIGTRNTRNSLCL